MVIAGTSSSVSVSVAGETTALDGRALPLTAIVSSSVLAPSFTGVTIRVSATLPAPAAMVTLKEVREAA